MHSHWPSTLEDDGRFAKIKFFWGPSKGARLCAKALSSFSIKKGGFSDLPPLPPSFGGWYIPESQDLNNIPPHPIPPSVNESSILCMKNSVPDLNLKLYEWDDDNQGFYSNCGWDQLQPWMWDGLDAFTNPITGENYNNRYCPEPNAPKEKVAKWSNIGWVLPAWSTVTVRDGELPKLCGIKSIEDIAKLFVMKVAELPPAGFCSIDDCPNLLSPASSKRPPASWCGWGNTAAMPIFSNIARNYALAKHLFWAYTGNGQVNPIIQKTFPDILKFWERPWQTNLQLGWPFAPPCTATPCTNPPPNWMAKNANGDPPRGTYWYALYQTIQNSKAAKQMSTKSEYLKKRVSCYLTVLPEKSSDFSTFFDLNTKCTRTSTTTT